MHNNILTPNLKQ